MDRYPGFLLTAGEDINERTTGSRSPLHVAAESNRQGSVKLLLKNKANPEAANKEGKTPLMVAVEQDNVEIAKALIEAGANVNARDAEGFSVAHFVAQNGLELFQVLRGKLAPFFTQSEVHVYG